MDEYEEVYFTMMEIREISRGGGMKQFLIDLKLYYPETYEDLKEQLNKIEKAKEVAALFKDVGSM